jgi:hypothetical protein
MSDIRKIVAALIAAQIVGHDKMSDQERMILTYGPDKDKANIRAGLRQRTAIHILGCVEIAELLCEISDTAAENRDDIVTSFVGRQGRTAT